MSGGFRRWGASLDAQSKHEALRHAAERGATGLLEARDDIRHKLVEEGWFGRQVTDEATYDAPMAVQPVETDAPSMARQAGRDGPFAGTVWDGGPDERGIQEPEQRHQEPDREPEL